MSDGRKVSRKQRSTADARPPGMTFTLSRSSPTASRRARATCTCSCGSGSCIRASRNAEMRLNSSSSISTGSGYVECRRCYAEAWTNGGISGDVLVHRRRERSLVHLWPRRSQHRFTHPSLSLVAGEVAPTARKLITLRQAIRERRLWGKRWGTEYVSARIGAYPHADTTPENVDFMRFSASRCECLLRRGQEFNCPAAHGEAAIRPAHGAPEGATHDPEPWRPSPAP